MSNADERLATYGTLAPGRVNHHVMDGMSGNWISGTVKGFLKEEGWGAELGFPGIVLDDNGGEIAVEVFQSSDLPMHWARLDDFEGEGYCRVPVNVATADGIFECSIYVISEQGAPNSK